MFKGLYGLGLLMGLMCAWGTHATPTPEGDPVWEDHFQFKQVYRIGQASSEVIFRAISKIPNSYALIYQKIFPTLNPLDPLSCKTFLDEVKDVIKGARLFQCSYSYKGQVGAFSQTIELIPPHDPLDCVLKSLEFKPNWSLGLLEVHKVEVSVFQDDKNGLFSLDLAPALKEVLPSVSLPVYEEAPDQIQQNRLYVPQGEKGPVFQAGGKVLTYFVPFLAGMKGFESSQEVTHQVLSDPLKLSESCVASCLTPPKKPLIVQAMTPFVSEEDNWTETSSITTTATTLDKKESLSFLEGFSSFQRDERNPTRVDSPFVYYDGKQFFATETFEQVCYPEEKGASDTQAPHTLRYTCATTLPVVLRNMEAITPKIPVGLYQYDQGKWLLLADSYKVKGAYVIPEAAKLEHDPPQPGPLLKALQDNKHGHPLAVLIPFTKQIWPFVDFPGDRDFDDLWKGWEKTHKFVDALSALPPEKKYLQSLVLQEIRNAVKPYTQDDRLMCSKKVHQDIKQRQTLWLSWSNYYSFDNDLSLSFAVEKTEVISLYCEKALPFIFLFKGALTQSLSYKQEREYAINYGTLDAEGKPIPFNFDKTSYAAVAECLRLGGFWKFKLYPAWGHHESDDIETIGPLADAVADSQTLQHFETPYYLGLANFKRLIQGIGKNQSLRYLYISCIFGAQPFVYLKHLMKGHKSLKEVYIDRYDDTKADLEWLNRLLKDGTDLEKLTIHLRNDYQTAYDSFYKKRLLPTTVFQGPTLSFQALLNGLLAERSPHLKELSISWIGKSPEESNKSSQNNFYAPQLWSVINQLKAQRPTLKMNNY